MHTPLRPQGRSLRCLLISFPCFLASPGGSAQVAWTSTTTTHKSEVHHQRQLTACRSHRPERPCRKSTPQVPLRSLFFWFPQTSATSGFQRSCGVCDACLCVYLLLIFFFLFPFLCLNSIFAHGAHFGMSFLFYECTLHWCTQSTENGQWAIVFCVNKIGNTAHTDHKRKTKKETRSEGSSGLTLLVFLHFWVTLDR